MTTLPRSSARSIGAFFRPTVARVLLFLALLVACFLSRVLFEGGPFERMSILVYTPLIEVPRWLGSSFAYVLGSMPWTHVCPFYPGFVNPGGCWPLYTVEYVLTIMFLCLWLYVISCLFIWLISTTLHRAKSKA